MANPFILDGIANAAALKERVKERAEAYLQAQGHRPGLATVLVGEDPASQVYVRSKIKTSQAVGLVSFEHKLAADVSQSALVDLIHQLNADERVHGILVQLPLPRGLDSDKVIETIAPGKDVDGLHPFNAGLLAMGKPSFIPCTPFGCLHLIRSTNKPLEGLNAVVIGRSVLVGKPVGQLLLNQNCTVTMAHSKTRDLKGVVQAADIVVAAVGRAEMIPGDWIKQGAVVIDVGINRVKDGEGNAKLVGDVHFESAKERASAITPVPGGVGPMTVAYLMSNTCRAAYLKAGMAWQNEV